MTIGAIITIGALGLVTIGIGSIIVKDLKRIENINTTKGRDGELSVNQRLHRLFPKAYIVEDIIIEYGNKQYSQIDSVVIDSSGVYVIECKNYTCNKIEASLSESMWKFTYNSGKTYDSYSPLFQNRRHCIEVAKVLGIDYADLISSIVFVEDTEFKFKGTIPNNTDIVCLSNLHTIKRTANIIPEDVLKEIYNILVNYSNPSKRVKRKQVKYAKSYA